ncbi:unnamed protein product [Ectocarpus sp. 12 AP-2014]
MFGHVLRSAQQPDGACDEESFPGLEEMAVGRLIPQEVQICTDSMVAGHPDYAQASREVGGIIAAPNMRDVYRCADSLVETGMPAADALSQAMGPWGNRYIRTSTPQAADTRLARWLEKYSKVNRELVKQGKKALFRERRGAQASTEDAVANVRKCIRKGCLFPGLPEEEQYSVDSTGPKTSLRVYHKRIGTGKNEGLHGLLKKVLVSQSTTVGPERSDRELAYMLKWYNDNIDVRRGIRKPDFMWRRTWSETRANALWTNIDSPNPGGNQRMPRGFPVGGGAAQAGLWNGGKEFIGHSSSTSQPSLIATSRSAPSWLVRRSTFSRRPAL